MSAAVRGGTGRARLNGKRAAARSLPSILYKRLYIPIYIFTRTHTYLTFFPISRRLFPVCKARGQRSRAACVSAATIGTERNERPAFLFTCF